MNDIPFQRKRSGGPKTAAGKAIAAGNALSHGLNSRLVTLATENPAEFEALFQGLVTDFKPNGTIETLIVHRIAHLIWKQRRLEGYEHKQISQAALIEVKIDEIFRKMNIKSQSNSVYEIFEFLDDYTKKDLEDAEEIVSECKDFEESSFPFVDPVTGVKNYPFLWNRVLPAELSLDPSLIAVYGLNGYEPDAEIMRSITQRVTSSHHHGLAVIFLVKNREAIHQARAAVRAEKMTLAWNLDRSHRYHTLLEGQIYRALKELRTQQGWQLGRIAIEPPPPLGMVD